LRLAAAGYAVWATARRPESLATLAAAGCRTLALDVTEDASMRAAIAAVEAAHGHLAVLVNNAGYGQQGPLEETPLADVRQQFEVNVFGPMRLCQLALPAMRAAGRGRIVNVSSMGGVLTFPGGSAYHGSKFAIEGISDVLRWEVAPFGIGVTVIQPGPTLTEYGEAALRSMESLAPGSASGPYGSFMASIKGALEGTFRGTGLAGASTPDDVACAIVESLGVDPAPSRVVVGDMARYLIDLRRSSSDAEWDTTLESMYKRPVPQS